jgi:hypothetical protein
MGRFTMIPVTGNKDWKRERLFVTIKAGFEVNRWN